MAGSVYRVPPPVFVGGQQPYQARDLSPAFEAVPVDAPPVRRAQPPFHSSWWAVALSPQQRSDSDMSSGIPGQSVDNPPAARSTIPSSAWWLSTPAPTQLRDLSPGIPGQSVDNPPAARSAVPPSAWWLTVPTPTQLRDMAPGIPGQSVDNPPGLQARTPAPQPVPFFDVQRRYLVQEFVAAAADSTPFARVVDSVIRSWQREQPLPTLPRLLSPSITAVPEDSPIPMHAGRTPLQVQLTAWFAGVLPYRPAQFVTHTAAPPGWSVDDPPRFRAFVVPPQPPTPLQVQYPKLVQESVAAAAADQSYARETLALRWWVVQAAPPVLPRLLSPGVPGQSADAPPPARLQQPAAVHYAAQPLAPVRQQLSPGIPGQSVDPPPSIVSRMPARAWYDGLYPGAQRQPGAAALAQQAQVDFAPVSLRGAGWSVAHWFAPYVAPQRHRPLFPAALAVRVDDPPFDARRLGRLASIIARAQIPTPDRVYLRYEVQEGPAFTLLTLVCGSITISASTNALLSTAPAVLAATSTTPVASAAPSSAPATSAETSTEPAVGGEPGIEICE